MTTTLTPPTTDGPPTRSGLVGYLLGSAKVAALPAAVAVAIVVAWGVVVEVFDVPAYLVPSPVSAWHSLVEHWPILWSSVLTTGQEVLVGFLFSVIIGVPLGIGLGESRWLQRAIYPLMVIAQIVPKVALGPLMIVWFGLGLTAKVVFIVLLSFFPIVINTMVGVASASVDFRRLARSVGLSGLATLRKVTLPQALPGTFAGLKIGMTLAVIGAVVAEFIAAQSGLGFLILTAQGQIDTPLLFASIFVLTVMGLVFYAVVALIEKVSTPWQGEERR